MSDNVITIDGLAGSGKSTIARTLAKETAALYLDTGAMYRALTYLIVERKISLTDVAGISSLLQSSPLDISYNNGKQETRILDKLLDIELSSAAVVDNVSEVAKISVVRDFLVKIQRKIVLDYENYLFVVEGRDIGTVVFPEAKNKFFITASPEVRAQRRFAQNKANGLELSYADVLDNILKRDNLDTNREISPAVPAQDATIIDSSDKTISEIINLIGELLKAN